MKRNAEKYRKSTNLINLSDLPIDPFEGPCRPWGPGTKFGYCPCTIHIVSQLAMTYQWDPVHFVVLLLHFDICFLSFDLLSVVVKGPEPLKNKPRTARVSKLKFKLVFLTFSRILVRGVFQWIRVAETSN